MCEEEEKRSGRYDIVIKENSSCCDAENRKQNRLIASGKTQYFELDQTSGPYPISYSYGSKQDFLIFFPLQ